MSSTTKKKHVEKEMFEDYTIPTENQTIARIVGPRGNNLHQVVTSSGEEYLASMLNKFRKHVWVKRGDYIVTESVPEGNKVKAEIIRILLKDQIHYLKKNDAWPDGFKDEDVVVISKKEESKDKLSEQMVDISLDDSNYDSDDSEGEFLVCNLNRPPVCYESDSETTSEEEKDSAQDADR